MYNDEIIFTPKMYCPECGLLMTTTFHVNPGNAMDVAEAVCPNDHKIILRVQKGAPEDKIVSQLAYLVKYDGGEVIYEDE